MAVCHRMYAFVPDRGHRCNRKVVPDRIVQRQIQRQTDQQQAAHADKPAGPADQAAAQECGDRLPDSQTDAVNQAVCRRIPEPLNKAAQRRHKARIAAVRRGADRRRTEALPELPEAGIRVSACNTAEKSCDRTLMIPLAQAQDRPDEQTVEKNRFHRLIRPQLQRCRCFQLSQNRWF